MSLILETDLDVKLSKIDNMLDAFVSSIDGMDCTDKRTELMKKLAFQISEIIDISDIERSSSDCYDKNYLSRHSSGWEIMLIAWGKGDQTKVHGHPEMCCYHYIKGRFSLEIFEVCDQGTLSLKKKLEVGAGDSYADCGEPDSYCNHIHRVTCLSEEGFSINMYSDDAKKGEEYEFEID
jgi:hypothetical protein